MRRKPKLSKPIVAFSWSVANPAFRPKPNRKATLPVTIAKMALEGVLRAQTALETQIRNLVKDAVQYAVPEILGKLRTAGLSKIVWVEKQMKHSDPCQKSALMRVGI